MDDYVMFSEYTPFLAPRKENYGQGWGRGGRIGLMGRKRGKGEERCRFDCTHTHAAFKPVDPPYFSQAVCSTFNLS